MISSLQGVSHWPNTLKRRFNKNTINMQFLITYRALKVLFQSKKKKMFPNWKDRRQEEKKWKNNTAVKSAVEKASDKWECFLTVLTVLKVAGLACLLCKKLFHNKCIAHNYKMHIPEVDDDNLENCILLGYYASSSGNHARRWFLIVPFIFSLQIFMWHGCGW